MAEQLNKRQTYTGKVVSDKMDKTIVVEVTRIYRDSRFHKILRSSKKYKVHDENKEAKLGDKVEFYEGKPASKTKCMYLSQVLSSA